MPLLVRRVGWLFWPCLVPLARASFSVVPSSGNTLQQCLSTELTWTEEPPIHLWAAPDDEDAPGDPTLHDFGVINSSSIMWTVNLPVGQEVSFTYVRTADPTLLYSSAQVYVVVAGSDTSCMPATATSVGSSSVRSRTLSTTTSSASPSTLSHSDSPSPQSVTTASQSGSASPKSLTTSSQPASPSPVSSDASSPDTSASSQSSGASPSGLSQSSGASPSVLSQSPSASPGMATSSPSVGVSVARHAKTNMSYIGGVVGGILAVLLACGIAFFLICRRRRNRRSRIQPRSLVTVTPNEILEDGSAAETQSVRQMPDHPSRSANTSWVQSVATSFGMDSNRRSVNIPFDSSASRLPLMTHVSASAQPPTDPDEQSTQPYQDHVDEKTPNATDGVVTPPADVSGIDVASPVPERDTDAGIMFMSDGVPDLLPPAYEDRRRRSGTGDP